ncbi:MAG: efflux RND transporter periplasmic adaptor subunit [Chloroflexota bacterium]|nr:MAG: efflux RND transporter periplasmic adaptor subunit [Chloroflexota bacterium]
MTRGKLWLGVGAIVIVLGALSIVGYAFAAQNKGSDAASDRHPVSTAQAVPVKVAPVVKTEVGTSLDLSGEVRARSTVMVLPKAGGRILNMSMDVGSRVQAGDLLAELETSAASVQVQQARAGLAAAEAKLAAVKDGGRAELVAQAQANLDIAKAKLATLEAGPRPETISQAAANLQIAEAKLDALKKGPTPEQIAVAETQVRLAKDQMYSVQTQADAVLGSRATAMGATVYTEDMKEAQSGAAYEQVKLAEAQLDLLKAPPTPEMLAQAEAGVELARQQLELAKKPFTDNDLAQARAGVQAAEQAVALAQNPASPNDLKALEATVDQARAALDLAKLQMDESKIVAPIDGVVVDRQLSEGSLAAPTTPILTLASTSLEIAVGVEEVKAGMIAVGQSVQITASAYPDAPFDGTVKSIAPSVDTRSRTVAVKIEPKDSDGKLKPGMFAQLSIKTQGRQAALVVPRNAVVGSGSQASVFVLSQDRIYKRSIKIGANRDQSIEVLSGVAEGDQVVVDGQSGLFDGQLVTVAGR